MRFLLDTHTILWWLSDDPTLAEEARSVIANPDYGVQVSAATAWEVAVKQAIGKLRIPIDFEGRLKENRIDQLPITVAHGLAAGALPRHHNDPFDRMLIAQAMSEGLTVVTRDQRFQMYQVATIAA